MEVMYRKVKIYCPNPDCSQHNKYYYETLSEIVKAFNIVNPQRLVQKIGYFIGMPQLQCAKCLWQVNVEIIE